MEAKSDGCMIDSKLKFLTFNYESVHSFIFQIYWPMILLQSPIKSYHTYQIKCF